MDLKLIENGNGGELVYENNDLTTINGLNNQVYLALFGGNPGATTPTERIDNQQLFDFWGNSFLEPSQQFNSPRDLVLTIKNDYVISVQEYIEQESSFLELHWKTNSI